MVRYVAFGLPDTIDTVLACRRSPRLPRLGLSGTGRGPARSAKPNCTERTAARKIAANTQITWLGRYGRRVPPLIATPERRTYAVTLHTHTCAADPQRLTPTMPRLE